MERIKYIPLKKRISWGSIIAGVVTVFAISILLSILASSIGLLQFDPQSSDPASGIGTTIGVITVLSLILSMAAGGFVAGKLAGADGIIHGFIVWATTMILAVVFMAMLTVGTVKMVGNILGSVTSMAGNVLSGVGSVVEGAGSGVANVAEGLFGDIDFSGDTDSKEVRQDIRQALKKSGVKELQPEYLNSQMKMVKSDFDKSVKKLVTNPNDAETIINGFLDRLSNRTEGITQNIDRDDLTRAIANNSSLSKAEVDKAADEYIELIDKAKVQGQEQIENLKQNIEEAKQELQALKQKALEETDKASNAAGRAGMISFFALLIGAGICGAASFFGAKMTQERYEV